MSRRTPLDGTRSTMVALVLLAITLTGCAAKLPVGNDPLDGAGSKPRGIDYRGFPYNTQAG